LVFLLLIRFFSFLRAVPAELILSGNYLGKAKVFDLVQKGKSENNMGEFKGGVEK